MPRLPVIPTVIVAYQVLIANFGTYLRLAWIPFCVCGFMQIGAMFLARLDDAPDKTYAFIASLIFLASYISTIPAITAWHRFLILGAENPDARIRYSIRAAEWAYVGKAILVYIAFSVAYGLVVFGVLTGVGTSVPLGNSGLGEALVSAIGWTLGFFLTAGFLLVLPSAAIGRDLSLPASMQAAQGNVSRLFAAYMVAYAPEFILSEVLYLVFPDDTAEAPTGYRVAYLIANLLVTFSFFTITISVLSIAYIRLVQRHSTDHGRASSS